jgi:Uma2 family endonuclease
MASIALPATFPAGEIVATDVPAETYLARYAEEFHEWVREVVIKMSLVSARHDLLSAYLRLLFDAYLEQRPAAHIHSQPFVMRLESIGSIREPDIQIIRHDNPGNLTDTGMIGPADICIEIVSPESEQRDYGEKYVEYERAGVREYWIIDPIRQRAQFNRLNDAGVYMMILPDDVGDYTTPLLADLHVHVSTLWSDDLPGVAATVAAVAKMLGDDQ